MAKKISFKESSGAHSTPWRESVFQLHDEIKLQEIIIYVPQPLGVILYRKTARVLSVTFAANPRIGRKAPWVMKRSFWNSLINWLQADIGKNASIKSFRYWWGFALIQRTAGRLWTSVEKNFHKKALFRFISLFPLKWKFHFLFEITLGK